MMQASPAEIIAATLLRLFSGGTLVVAGFAKLQMDRATRLRVLRSYRIGPAALLLPAASLLPVSEIALGVTLLLGALQPVGAILSAALLLIITGGVLLSLARGIEAPCGCFGRSAPIGRRIVVRNAVLLAAIAVIGAFHLNRPGVAMFPLSIQLATVLLVAVGLSLVAKGLTKMGRPPFS